MFTVSGPITASSPEAQLRLRLEMMEKSLNEYKELCSSLEKEVNGKEFTEMSKFHFFGKSKFLLIFFLESPQLLNHQQKMNNSINFVKN